MIAAIANTAPMVPAAGIAPPFGTTLLTFDVTKGPVVVVAEDGLAAVVEEADGPGVVAEGGACLVTDGEVIRDVGCVKAGIVEDVEGVVPAAAVEKGMAVVEGTSGTVVVGRGAVVIVNGGGKVVGEGKGGSGTVVVVVGAEVVVVEGTVVVLDEGTLVELEG